MTPGFPPPPLALYNARANREGEVVVHSLELKQFFLGTSWEARLRASQDFAYLADLHF